MRFQYLSVILIIATTTMLSACGDEETAMVENPTNVPLHYLSKDGVGPINAATPFNLRLMGEVFPDLNVSEEMMFRDGDKYPVIKVRAPDAEAKPILSINPDYSLDKVFSVVVHDQAIGNRFQHVLGTQFVEIYPHDAIERCAEGVGEFAGKVLCLAPKSTNVLYQFGGKWSGPMGKMPPLTVLANWELESLVWKPPVQTAAAKQLAE